LTAAALLLPAAAAAAAQPAAPAKPKATPPPAAPAADVRFPAFAEKTLANGLRVVVIEQHEQPLVSLRMVLKAGKSFEPAGKPGLAQATAALLTKGTASRSAQQIAETIDFVGGQLGASTGIESGFVNAAVTADQLDLGFELLADVVLHPTFPQDELDRWRRQALSGLQVQMQNAGYLADTALVRTLFGDHPYGRPEAGTAESLQALTRDELVAFHQRRYVPNQTLLAIVGDVKPADAFARAERAFAGWQKGEEAKRLAAGVPAAGRRILVIDKPDAVQTEIRVGQVALAYRDPDLFASEVYNSVVGGNASARLYKKIRQERGLSYGARSFFVQANETGWFQASTFTKTETTVEALELALEVLREMQKEPVPEGELAAAKTYITGAFPLEIETADGIASKVLEAMIFGYGREFLESYNANIGKVGGADVQRFARERIDPERMTIVLAGNAKAFAETLGKKLGAFETLPAAEVDFLRADLRKPKAETPAAVSEEDQARALEILRRAHQALGGQAFLEQRTQISRGSGTMRTPGVPQPTPILSLVTYNVFPMKKRSELQFPTGTMVQAFDGATGWVGTIMQASEGVTGGADVRPLTQDITAQVKQQQLYGFDVLREAGKPGYTARPLADAEVNGKPAQVVELADAEGHATQFFVDAETNLITKVAFTTNGRTTEAVYSDYREVSGVEVPFQTHVSQDGQPLLEITLSEAQVNAPVDEELFKKPAG
jgi:zinc protease